MNPPPPDWRKLLRKALPLLKAYVQIIGLRNTIKVDLILLIQSIETALLDSSQSVEEKPMERESKISPEEVDKVLGESLPKVKELRKTLDRVFDKPSHDVRLRSSAPADPPPIITRCGEDYKYFKDEKCSYLDHCCHEHKGPLYCDVFKKVAAAEIERLRRIVKQFKKGIDTYINWNDELMEQVKQLEAKSESLQKLLNRRNDEIEKCEQEIFDLKEQVKQLEAERIRLRSVLKEELETARAESITKAELARIFESEVEHLRGRHRHEAAGAIKDLALESFEIELEE